VIAIHVEFMYATGLEFFLRTLSHVSSAWNLAISFNNKKKTDRNQPFHLMSSSKNKTMSFWGLLEEKSRYSPDGCLDRLVSSP
jgi:hypothetical protein